MPVFNYPATALNEVSARLAAAEAAISELSQAIADNVDPMVGATGVADGISGLVPVPLAGQQESLLKGDATWLPTSAIGRSLLNSANASAVVSTLSLGTAALADTGDFQPLSANLTEIAVNSSEWGRTFLESATSSAAITALELGTAALQDLGSFQLQSDDLQAIAELTTNGLLQRTGLGTAEIVALSAFMKAMLDDADAAAARSSLGLGTAATTADTDYVKMTGTQTVAGLKTFSGYPTTFSSGDYSSVLVRGNLGAFLNFKSTSGGSAQDFQFYVSGGTASNNQGNCQVLGNHLTFFNTVSISNSTASTSTTTGALVVGNGGIGVAGFITPGDNVSIKVKRVTGTLNALPTTSTSAAHGLSATNIVGAICVCKQNGNPSNGFAPGHSLTSANYAFSFNGTNIQIDINASATTISGGQYEVLLIYRP